MKALLTSLVLSPLLAIPAAGVAQQTQAPVTAALSKIAQRAERNLVEAAEQMPADKYGFKPTPAQMTFGKLMLHVAGSNEYLCSAISGAKAPEEEELPPTAGKEEIVARLKQSFEFCTSALARVDDSKLGEEIPFFGGRTVSRATAVLGLAEDWGDHYGAAAIYMRLNNVLPPTARRGES